MQFNSSGSEYIPLLINYIKNESYALKYFV